MGKILITWWAWYIWSHTVHYLIEKWISKDNIVIFDNLSTWYQTDIPDWVKFYKWDLLNKNDLKNCFEENTIESVIHFAAYSIVWESITNPWKYFENNIPGWVNLLEQMRTSWTKYIIFSSSAAIFWNPKYIPINEKHEKNPVNVYWETKLIFENILNWYDKIYWVKSVSLRYFNAAWAAYWLRENHNPETHLIPLVINTALWKRDSINIFWNDYPTPDWTCIRDYIHVIDLAEAHFKSLEYLKKNNKSEQLNLGTWKWTSVNEIINLVKNVSWIDFLVKVKDRRIWDPDTLVADSKKIREMLGWESKYNIEDIINSAFEWHKKFHK